MVMSDDEIVALVADDLFPKWQAERALLDRIDRWARWSHDDPHRPRQATPEYRELAARSQTPWGDLIVGSVAQMMRVDGYRSPHQPEDQRAWRLWNANRWDSRQVAVHRAPLTYGLGYALSLPGTDRLTGEALPVMRGVSPREMLALYDDVAWDEWPSIAIRVVTRASGYDIHVYDAEVTYHLRIETLGDKPTLLGVDGHDTGVTPVVRYANRLDLEGRASGEIEPFIPVMGRIDQTVFDRLVVQRFASWVVRTIAGMSTAETAAANGVSVDQVAMKLKVEDFLTSEDPDTKFGTLPATPMEGFIKAHDDDLQVLAAVSQTPAHEVLGIAANLSADALAAAKAGQTAKGDERRQEFGSSHNQLVRLACHQAGYDDLAADFDAGVRWADTSIRSLSQAADALGKLAEMLGIPAQVLWTKVPGLTDQDLDEARRLLEEDGGMASLLREIVGQVTVDDTPTLEGVA